MSQRFASLLFAILLHAALVFVCADRLHAEVFFDPQAFKNAGSRETLAAYLEQVYQEVLDSGVKNHNAISLFLASEARNALQQKKYSRAGIMAEYAHRISPDLAPVFIIKARAAWGKNKLFLHTLMAGYARNLAAKIRSLEDFCFWAFGNLCVLVAAFLGTLCLFTLISLQKYFVLVFHDLRHIVARAIPDRALWAMITVVFLLPFFLNMTFFWACLFCLILLFSYHGAKERVVVTALAFAFTILVPAAIIAISFCLFVPQSEVLNLIWKANYEHCVQGEIDKLEQYALENPNDAEVLFSLGLINKKEQNYMTAQRYFQKALEVAPGHYKAYINLGNTLLAREKWDDAVQNYAKAIKLQPERSAAAHFNYARAYQQKFMFKEAEKELSAAKKINDVRIDRYLKIYSENYNRLVIDESISKNEFFSKCVSMFRREWSQSRPVWDLFFMGVQLPFGVVGILIIVFFNALSPGRESIRLATKCTLCGKAICKRCQRNISSEILCFQCLNFLKKQDSLGIKVKEEKTTLIQKYLRAYKKTGIILGWIFPGAGHIWKGHPIRGSVYLFTFFVLLAKLASIFILEGPWDFLVSTKATEAIMLVALTLLLWVLVYMDVRRVRSKELEGNVALRSLAIEI